MRPIPRIMPTGIRSLGAIESLGGGARRTAILGAVESSKVSRGKEDGFELVPCSFSHI